MSAVSLIFSIKKLLEATPALWLPKLIWPQNEAIIRLKWSRLAGNEGKHASSPEKRLETGCPSTGGGGEEESQTGKHLFCTFIRWLPGKKEKKFMY